MIEQEKKNVDQLVKKNQLNYLYIRMPKEHVILRRQSYLENQSMFTEKQLVPPDDFASSPHIQHSNFQQMPLTPPARHKTPTLTQTAFNKLSSIQQSTEYSLQNTQAQQFKTMKIIDQDASSINKNSNENQLDMTFQNKAKIRPIIRIPEQRNQKVVMARLIRTENQSPIDQKNTFFGSKYNQSDEVESVWKQQIQRSLQIDQQILNELGQTINLPTSYGEYSLKKTQQANYKRLSLPRTNQRSRRLVTQGTLLSPKTATGYDLTSQSTNNRSLRTQRIEDINSSIDKDIVKQNVVRALGSTMAMTDQLNDIAKSNEKISTFEIDLHHLYNSEAKMTPQKSSPKVDQQGKNIHELFIKSIRNFPNEIISELYLNYSKQDALTQQIKAAQSKVVIDDREYHSQLIELANIFRHLIRTSEDMGYNLAFQKTLSLFFKSFIMLQDTKIYSDKDILDIEIRKVKEKMNKQIDELLYQHKLTTDQAKQKLNEKQGEIRKLEEQLEKVKQDNLYISELLRDREAELRNLKDPHGMTELKQLLNELDREIEGCEKAKTKQYKGMNHIVGMLNQFDREYQDRKKNQKIVWKIPKRRQKKEEQVGDKQLNLQPETRIIMKAQKSNINYGLKQESKGKNGDNEESDSNDEDIDPTHLQNIKYNDSQIDIYDYWMRNLEVVNEQKMILLQLQNELANGDASSDKIQQLCENYMKFQEAYLKIEKLMARQVCEQAIQTDQAGDISLSPIDQKKMRRSTISNASQQYLTTEQMIGTLDEEKQKLAERLQKKNPLVKAIKHYIASIVNQKQSSSEMNQKLNDQMILRLVEQTMEDKVKSDIDNDRLDFNERQDEQLYSAFLYDQLLMQYGLKTIALKNLLQLSNGLKGSQSIAPYANLISRMIGFTEPFLMKDQIAIINRSSFFFKEVQQEWIKKVNKKAMIKLSDEQINNLKNGGDCVIFEIIDELRFAFRDDKDLTERILTNIKPDCIRKADPNNQQNLKRMNLEFILLKITSRISKIGKDLKIIYDTLDKDKSGSLESKELLVGLRNSFYVFLSYDESEELLKYLDEDGSGDIDFLEFYQKINFNDLQEKAQLYTISKISFIDMMLREWDYYTKREREKLMDLFKKYDDNGDGVLALDEFEGLLKSLEPSIKKKKVLALFKETLEKFEDKTVDDDTLSPEAFCQMVWFYKLGGCGKEFFNDYFKTKYANTKTRKSVII